MTFEDQIQKLKHAITKLFLELSNILGISPKVLMSGFKTPLLFTRRDRYLTNTLNKMEDNF